MAKMNIAPTKSNLLIIKEQLGTAKEGYELVNKRYTLENVSEKLDLAIKTILKQ